MSNILVNRPDTSSFISTELKLIIEILERNKMIIETANEQKRN